MVSPNVFPLPYISLNILIPNPLIVNGPSTPSSFIFSFFRDRDGLRVHLLLADKDTCQVVNTWVTILLCCPHQG